MMKRLYLCIDDDDAVGYRDIEMVLTKEIVLRLQLYQGQIKLVGVVSAPLSRQIYKLLMDLLIYAGVGRSG